MSLVLSLFPGIGLLDMAFEQEGFCVVRGPDLLWGGDIRNFHPPAYKFDGVIGGPPCQAFSRLRHLNPRCGEKHGNMIPEFERCVREAMPHWYLMENVDGAPLPRIGGARFYHQSNLWLSNRSVGGVQERKRRFTFGSIVDGAKLVVEHEALWPARAALAVTSGSTQVPVKLGGSGKVKSTIRAPVVLAGHGPVGRGHDGYKVNISIEDACELQGVPRDFFAEAPLTAHGKRKMIGNGVPLPMGLAIAKAVKKAIE